jgi:hypothetical protein
MALGEDLSGGYSESCNSRLSEWAMAAVDHLALARAYRDRAATCLVSAETTTSNEFSKCYRQLADYYDGRAT